MHAYTYAYPYTYECTCVCVYCIHSTHLCIMPLQQDATWAKSRLAEMILLVNKAAVVEKENTVNTSAPTAREGAAAASGSSSR